MTKVDTRGRILSEAFGLFRREGFGRVSVDAIAARAGVTKRTVYYHFQSKDDIVAEVLTDQHAYMLAQFRDWAGNEPLGPDRLVANLFVRLEEWAAGPDWLGSGFTRIATELADRPGHPARRAASRHKTSVEAWLAAQFGTAGLGKPADMARRIMILIEGAMMLALIHGDTDYIRSAGAAAAELVGRQ